MFRNEDGKPYKSIRRSFANALKRAKITDCTLHSLRHTFASHLAEKTDNLATVKEILVHKTLAMTLRYSHSNREKKLKAVEGLYKKKVGTNLAQIADDEAPKNTKAL